jgi:hypothetical protein
VVADLPPLAPFVPLAAPRPLLATREKERERERERERRS